MARLSNVFRPEELRYVIIERRQLLVNLGENNLVILMDLSSRGLCIDCPQIRGQELEEFTRKFNLLTEKELNECLQIDVETFMTVLNQCVSCLGCRRRVERLYKQLTDSGHPVLDPLVVIQSSGHLTISGERLKSPQSLGTLLYRHHDILNNLLENKLRNKTRCVQHSMEMFRSKPFSEIWRDAWSSMNRMCRDEFAVIETQELYAVLQNYLKRHKFCSGCRTKIDKAYKILVGESRTKEKGYVAALYANIKKCYPDKHVHLVTNKIEFFDALIRRAEPEIIGSMTKARERHAKTMEVAQEEVLTCIGMILYERLRQAYICMREEERACQLLAAVGIHALYRNFDRYVEKKQGMSNLELLYQQMSRAEKAKQLKRELRKLKKKQKKNEKRIQQIRLNADDDDVDVDVNEDETEEVAEDEVVVAVDCRVEAEEQEEEEEEDEEEDNNNHHHHHNDDDDDDVAADDEADMDQDEGVTIKDDDDDEEEEEEEEEEEDSLKNIRMVDKAVECALDEVLCRILPPHQMEALEAPMTVVRNKKKRPRKHSTKQKQQEEQQKSVGPPFRSKKKVVTPLPRLLLNQQKYHLGNEKKDCFISRKPPSSSSNTMTMMMMMKQQEKKSTSMKNSDVFRTSSSSSGAAASAASMSTSKSKFKSSSISTYATTTAASSIASSTNTSSTSNSKSMSSSATMTSSSSMQSAAKCNDCQSLSVLSCRCESDVKDSGYGSEPSLSQTNSLNSSGLCSPEGSEISCTEGYCNHQREHDRQRHQHQHQHQQHPMQQQQHEQHEELLKRREEKNGTSTIDEENSSTNIKENYSTLDIDIGYENDDGDGMMVRMMQQPLLMVSGMRATTTTQEEEEDTMLMTTTDEEEMTAAHSFQKMNRFHGIHHVDEKDEHHKQKDENEDENERLMMSRSSTSSHLSNRRTFKDSLDHRVNYTSLEDSLLTDIDKRFENAYIPPEVVQQYLFRRQEVQQRRHLLRESLRANFSSMCSMQKQQQHQFLIDGVGSLSLKGGK